jgi:hypothetical protein
MSSTWHWLILLFYCAAPLAAGYAIVSRRKCIGKMGRLPYFLRVFIGPVVISILLKILLEIVTPTEISMQFLIVFSMINFLVYIVTISLIVFWTIDRLNDIGAGKFQAVAVAIPLVGVLLMLYLCFKRGRPAELAEAQRSTPIEFDERLAERKQTLLRRESETKEN